MFLYKFLMSCPLTDSVMVRYHKLSRPLPSKRTAPSNVEFLFQLIYDLLLLCFYVARVPIATEMNRGHLDILNSGATYRQLQNDSKFSVRDAIKVVKLVTFWTHSNPMRILHAILVRVYRIDFVSAKWSYNWSRNTQKIFWRLENSKQNIYQNKMKVWLLWWWRVTKWRQMTTIVTAQILRGKRHLIRKGANSYMSRGSYEEKMCWYHSIFDLLSGQGRDRSIFMREYRTGKWVAWVGTGWSYRNLWCPRWNEVDKKRVALCHIKRRLKNCT